MGRKACQTSLALTVSSVATTRKENQGAEAGFRNGDRKGSYVNLVGERCRDGGRWGGA